MTKKEINEIKSEIIRLQQILMNHYWGKPIRPLEGDEMQPHRDELKKLRDKIGISAKRLETVVYRR